MAMVTCPECGKRVSGKDLKCPYCGAKLNVKICCPKCNSEDVRLDIKDRDDMMKFGLLLIFGRPWYRLFRKKYEASITVLCNQCGHRFSLEK